MRCAYGLCDGSGWTVDERTRTATPCRCLPEQRAARTARSLRARIPREYQDASFDHTNINGLPRAAVRQVRRYVETLDERLGAGDGLWISGSIGTGKTWLAMLVARYAIERGQAVAVYSVPRLLSEIRRTYDGEGRTTLELLDQLTSVTLLVLDDVGTERTNPWVLEQLYSIINERWQERRAIVLTTNLDPEQMREQLGERAVSRLVGMCETVLVEGVDHRTGRHYLDPGPTQFDDPPDGPRPGATGHAGLGPTHPSHGGDGPSPARRGDGQGYGDAWDAAAGRSAPQGDPYDAPRPGGSPLGPPPPFDPRDAEAAAAWDRGADGHAAARPAPPTWGVDPDAARPPVRHVHREDDHRRRR
ncbi:ATP-binding protein [Patulibacter sp. SYSU D01012]|uniref:ATP-binding protein n=1 Tax=Patulibacter sp. SYSU D01012 TaxID=2817381 RepID=UPI001B305E77|nr:ATP-binding protein [Patulibacter sp. SYSU D01012]